MRWKHKILSWRKNKHDEHVWRTRGKTEQIYLRVLRRLTGERNVEDSPETAAAELRDWRSGSGGSKRSLLQRRGRRSAIGGKLEESGNTARKKRTKRQRGKMERTLGPIYKHRKGKNGRRGNRGVWNLDEIWRLDFRKDIKDKDVDIIARVV